MKKLGLGSLMLIIALGIPATGATAKRRTAKPATVTEASAAHGNADYINADQLKDYLTFVASDEMEGRDTPSRGLDTTAKYIASQLARWGLKPAGDDGTYFQRIALRRNKVDAGQTRVEINGQTFNFGEDFLAGPAAVSVSGEVVYVSHGWFIKSKNIDAYQGLDIKDKIMVIAGGGLPKGVTQADLTGKQGEDWDFAFNIAQKRGAKAIIFIPGFQNWSGWERNRQNAIERGAVEVEKFRNPNAPSFPIITASARLLNAIFQGEKQSAVVIFNRAAAGDPVEPFALKPEKKVSLNLALRTEMTGTQNVVAILEGSDAALKNEYVAIGAHYDHVGIGTPVNGDGIYNGADDDGSGTVSVLAMAEAFARGPRPKRSILFIWHAGEEKGLWGSRYFTDNPTIPLDKIVAQLNIDMIGRTRKENDTPGNQALPKPGEVFLIGPKMMSVDLMGISEAVNKSYLNLRFDYKYDDIKHPDNFFFRSDHYNYARKGIPIIFYMDGEHDDYHRVTDSVEKIDFQNMEKVARTVYATAWELATRPNRPKVDKIPALEGNH